MENKSLLLNLFSKILFYVILFAKTEKTKTQNLSFFYHLFSVSKYKSANSEMKIMIYNNKAQPYYSFLDKSELQADHNLSTNHPWTSVSSCGALQSP